MVPAGVELFGADAALLGLVGFEKVQRQAPQGGQILRGVPGARPAFVFAHLHVEHPVQLIFHAPVPAHGGKGSVLTIDNQGSGSRRDS